MDGCPNLVHLKVQEVLQVCYRRFVYKRKTHIRSREATREDCDEEERLHIRTSEIKVNGMGKKSFARNAFEKRDDRYELKMNCIGRFVDSR